MLIQSQLVKNILKLFLFTLLVLPLFLFFFILTTDESFADSSLWSTRQYYNSTFEASKHNIGFKVTGNSHTVSPGQNICYSGEVRCDGDDASRARVVTGRIFTHDSRVIDWQGNASPGEASIMCPSAGTANVGSMCFNVSDSVTGFVCDDVYVLNADTWFNITNGWRQDATVKSTHCYTITLPPAPEPPVVTITAAPNPVDSGATTLIDWSSSNANSCTAVAGPGFSTGGRENGTDRSFAIFADTTFTVRCDGDGGATTRSTRVSVNTQPPASIITFTANPTSVAEGAQSNLSWTATGNISSCAIHDMTNGVLVASGRTAVDNIDVTPLPAPSVQYRLTCYSVQGNDTASLTVGVNTVPDPVPTITFVSEPGNPIPYDSAVTLSWTSSNADSCTQVSGPGFNTGGRRSGSDGSDRLTSDTLFQIRCDGPGGSNTRSLTVRVDSAPGPSVTLTSSPSNPIPYDSRATLSWTSSNADFCEAVNGPGFDTGGRRSGDDESGRLTFDAIFSIRCVGEGGSVTRNHVVNVTPAPPSVSIDSIESPVENNRTAQVTWSSGGANSCRFTSGAGLSTGGRTLGSSRTTQLTSDETVTLECTGPGGTVSDTRIIGVLPSIPTLNIPIDFVAPGGSVTAVWGEVFGSDVTCTGIFSGDSGGWDTTTKDTDGGSEEIGPIFEDSSYRISCSNAHGTKLSGIQTVGRIDPSASITALPDQILKSKSTTVSWEAVGVLGACELYSIPRDPDTNRLLEGEKEKVRLENTNTFVQDEFKDENKHETGSLSVSTDYIVSCPTMDLTNPVPLEAEVTVSVFVPTFEEQ